MIVLDPSALTGFHKGPLRWSDETGQAYVITADGAIAADGSYDAGTLDEAQLVNMGSDWFMVIDGSLAITPPTHPVQVGRNPFEGAHYATFIGGQTYLDTLSVVAPIVGTFDVQIATSPIDGAFLTGPSDGQILLVQGA